MILSDISIKRPVVSIVATIVVVVLGAMSFRRLPVREYPSIDTPIVSIQTSYRGASAAVVESKITEAIEKEVASIEGLKIVRSSSAEQFSSITLEFEVGRNIDEAASDVRDRVSRARGSLPAGVDDPRVQKTDADASPIISLAFNSPSYSRLEMVEMIERLALQRLQTIPGVGSATVRGPRYAMRMWVDADRLAAYGLTITDVENALRQQNIEAPGGRIESLAREFPVQIQGRLTEVADFENLVLATRGNYQVKFADIGRVELGSEDYRSETYFKGIPTVSVSIIRQSQANLLDVAQRVKEMIPVIKADLPQDVEVNVASDTSVFVERSVREVYKTLWEAALLVVLMIFLFLRDWRATVIPLIAIPVSIIGSFSIMSALGFSINVLTLLALVLAVGLVVDDAIVMLENIYRRIEEGEAPIRASVFGARQVAFAVISTTLTLAAVFVPVAFQSGRVGRLFYEFGITLAISVLVSAFVALSLTPMLCSRMLRAKLVGGKNQHGWFYEKTEPFFVFMNSTYEWLLRGAFRWHAVTLLAALGFSVAGFYLYTKLQRELTPAEDRGVLNASLIAPVGSTPEYLRLYSYDMEKVVLDIPEVERTFHRTGDGGRAQLFITLKPWEERKRTTQEISTELRRKFGATVTGGQPGISAVRPFGGGGGGRGGGGGSGMQMVLQGSDFDELQRLGAEFVGPMRDSGMFVQPRIDPSPTKPQLDVRIDRAKAADLRVRPSDVASVLESLLGGRRVTEIQRGNQQYYVIVQVEDARRVTPSDLSRLYVRSADGALVQLSNLVTSQETSVPEGFPHFNRLRSVTLSSQLAQGYTMDDGVKYLKEQAATLPEGYSIAWDGETREFVEGASDTFLLFGLALGFTFLILAAQFESWIHPVTIFSGVALALAAGLLVLWSTGLQWAHGAPQVDPPPKHIFTIGGYGLWWTTLGITDNLFSRFGLIMLIGLVAKNGILIVEFANQLQIAGRNAFDAVFEASKLRLRPILMTSISTVLGAVPIAFASGAGSETRHAMGTVVVGGLSISTGMTLFVVPLIYLLMDKLSVAVTGHSSAQGLIRAAQIQREVHSAADPAEHVPVATH